jgi:galactoside O-acetyltransferase
MTSFYDAEELRQLGFAKVGSNVLISRKASIYGAENMSIGSNVRIDDFCILSGKINIGNYIHIAAYSALYGGVYGIFIDDFSNISSRVSIYALSDDYSGESMTNPMIPNKYKKIIEQRVEIQRHVIVGSGSVILPGCVLSIGSSFGALTLINRDSEEWSVNAGIPFKKIKERSRHILELEKELLRENKDE